ncbi:MAG: TlpA family protein disulfide reductase [Chloroflexi bacterium]|nr:TlpA family protein disulfide reductase [Chloroflexota bacterium]
MSQVANSESTDEVRSDSSAARVARFLAGSIFGIAFVVLCFLMLTAALKGPDKVTMDGVTLNAGLVPGQKILDRRLAVGDIAPDFALNQIGGGNPVQLSKFTAQQGKVVFINFWASWCQPCRDEMKDINDFYLAHKNENVQVLTINYREDEATIKSFFKDNNLIMPVVLDTEGKVAGGYKATAFPESYFIDKTGVIRELKNDISGANQSSALTRTEMEQKLQTTLAATK